MVMQIPLAYFGSRSICLKQFNPKYTKAVVLFSTLMAMHCEMAYTAGRRSAGMVLKNKDDKKPKTKKMQIRRFGPVSQLEGDDEPADPMFSDTNLSTDGDGDNGGDLPDEPHPFAVVSVMEEIYKTMPKKQNGEEKPEPTTEQPIALRMHFFYKTTRTKVWMYFWQKIFEHELRKMSAEKNPGKAARIFQDVGDIHKIDFNQYWV